MAAFNSRWRSLTDKMKDNSTSASIKNHNILKDALIDLIDTFNTLRDPDRGCPWDKNQTHSSLIPYVLEEAHEVADAIRHGTAKELKEELGDLLLQIILHSKIAQENDEFELKDVINELTRKLIRRHPNIFEKSNNHQK